MLPTRISFVKLCKPSPGHRHMKREADSGCSRDSMGKNGFSHAIKMLRPMSRSDSLLRLVMLPLSSINYQILPLLNVWHSLPREQVVTHIALIPGDLLAVSSCKL